jgi:acyl carrier protein
MNSITAACRPKCGKHWKEREIPRPVNNFRAGHRELSPSTEGPQLESLVNDYISREIVQDPALLPLSNDASLLEGGILDSLSLLRLVVFLEKQFNITVGESDLLPENFDNVNTICTYLRERERGRQGATHG